MFLEVKQTKNIQIFNSLQKENIRNKKNYEKKIDRIQTFLIGNILKNYGNNNKENCKR